LRKQLKFEVDVMKLLVGGSIGSNVYYHPNAQLYSQKLGTLAALHQSYTRLKGKETKSQKEKEMKLWIEEATDTVHKCKGINKELEKLCVDTATNKCASNTCTSTSTDDRNKWISCSSGAKCILHPKFEDGTTWFHYNCISPRSELDYMAFDNNPKAHWFCPACSLFKVREYEEKLFHEEKKLNDE